jgi:uncharacterized membrane protein YfcA
MKTTYLNNNIKSILAIIIVTAALAYFFLVTIKEVKGNDQITIAIVSVLSSATGYYFGSSAGSAKKDDTIAANMANQTADK